MAQRICSFLMAAVLLGALPALASAQSRETPKLQPATVVRPGGVRAGIAPPPPTERGHARFHTTEHGESFEPGVGVVVGSFARPFGGRTRARDCIDLSSTPTATVPVQPQISQPAVSQPGYSSGASTSTSVSDGRVCGARRAP
jgi:hypothetical protein